MGCRGEGMGQWGVWGSSACALPAGSTLGFGQVANYLGAVLKGRALGHEKGSPTSAS
jgi:hypothetical protein